MLDNNIKDLLMCVEVLQLRTLPLGADNPAPPGADNPPLPLPKQAQAPERGRNFGRIFRPRRIIRPLAHRQGASPREGAEFWPESLARPDNPPLRGAGLSAPKIFTKFHQGASPREGAEFPPENPPLGRSFPRGRIIRPKWGADNPPPKLCNGQIWGGGI